MHRKRIAWRHHREGDTHVQRGHLIGKKKMDAAVTEQKFVMNQRDLRGYLVERLSGTK